MDADPKCPLQEGRSSAFHAAPCSLILGDCLEAMKNLPDKSVDAIITDLPYAMTSNKWDTPFPVEAWWVEAMRVCRGAVVTTASQPFTARMVMSNLPWFRHEWVWIKNRGSNFANTVREPMKEHESVLVFAEKKWTYNKQMQERTGGGADRVNYGVAFRSQSDNYREFEGRDHQQLPEMRVPSSWQKFNCEVGLHPTQKPLELMRYMVRTYTNPGDVVLDTCMGSGTTCLAAKLEGRGYIGIEREPKYFETAKTRIEGDADLFSANKDYPEQFSR